mgnify:CR=1 FL=1
MLSTVFLYALFAAFPALSLALFLQFVLLVLFVLLLQSDEDYRCWMGDAIQMFSAVKRQGVDTRMVLFHGENHELSRSGKPQNRITRLKELMNWFGKYLTKEEDE